jgi:hypothetical protein
MKYCPACGSELRPGAKFCPSCGHDLKGKDNAPIWPKPSPPSKKGRGGFFTKLIVLAALIAGGYFILTEVLRPGNSNATAEWLEEVVGTYHDHTGVLLGSPDIYIDVYKMEGKIIGRARDGKLFDFDLLPIKKYRLQGPLSRDGLRSDFKVEYDPSRSRLIFSYSDFSPSTWYIQKVK